MEQTLAGAFQTRRRRGCRAQTPGRRAGASARACHLPARGYAVLSPGQTRFHRCTHVLQMMMWGGFDDDWVLEYEVQNVRVAA